MRSAMYALFAAVVLSGNVWAGDGGQGGYFGPAAVVKQGKLIIGAEGQYFMKGPKALGVLGHVRYGLAPRFQLNGDAGVLRGETYFGGGVEYQVFYDGAGSVGLTVRGGGFANTDGMGSGLDLSANIGNRFGSFSLYGGFDTKWIMEPSNRDPIFYITGGIHIPFKQKVAFVGEIGADISDQSASYLSGGVLFYF